MRSFDGSPPLAWGPLLLLPRLVLARRFTPTRVGTTAQPASDTIRAPVHPHSRGDHPKRRPMVVNRVGSPPLAWGPLPELLELSCGQRFTPTRVGTTRGSVRRVATSTVHPHSRGDHFLIRHPAYSSSGSPPLAWGPPSVEERRVGQLRFTPTRVGTTDDSAHPTSHPAVHPHSRGDHQSAVSGAIVEAGSPPLAWGPPPDAIELTDDLRFTPTRVGTTTCDGPCRSAPTVHPHSRGDHWSDIGSYLYPAGSPPLAWGPRSHVCLDAIAHRFTPTRVGTTRPGSDRHTRPPVHPHSRGDH